jgi:YVTN family beta-propeller protein
VLAVAATLVAVVVLPVSLASARSTARVPPLVRKGHTYLMPEGDRPAQITVDSRRHIAYIADADETDTTIISTIHGRPRTIPVPSFGPDGSGIAIDEATGLAYVPDQDFDQVDVLRGAKQVATIAVPSGSEPEQALIDRKFHLIYIVDANSNAVTVIDEHDRKVLATIPLQGEVGYGGPARYGAVDPRTGILYVPSTADGEVVEIKGQRIIRQVPALAPGFIAIDAPRDLIYVLDYDSDYDEVTVLSGTSPVARIIHVGTEPAAISVDHRTGFAYVTLASSEGTTPKYGPTVVIKGTRIVARLHGGAPLAEIGPGVDPRNGIVLIPDGRHLEVVRGTKVVARILLRGRGDLDTFTAFDTSNGRAVLVRATDDTISRLETPATRHAQ